MRVLVTGASGFVGRWLCADLGAAGHEVVEPPAEFDVTDSVAVAAALSTTQPDAIAHLAALSFAADAAADPERAFAVAVAGTINVLESAHRLRHQPAVLVAGSAEVYGLPEPADLPLREDAPLRPRTPYALSKAAQESIALAYAARYRLAVVVARSFNQVGPGQRPEFVVPALARRVRDMRDGRAADIPVGNLDVRRDLTDVRDAARAYRQLLETAGSGRAAAPSVVNVCSGESVSIRSIVEGLAELAGVEPRTRTDASLVRTVDAPEVRGDHQLLTSLTGWLPRIPLAQTLADVWRDVDGEAGQA